ncbi:MAG: TonB family protein [Spirochaetales bacterium]|nr:TonB family protein [Spirochaetales bacterium]
MNRQSHNKTDNPVNKNISRIRLLPLLRKISIPSLVIVVHIVLIFTITLSINEKQQDLEPAVFKMVDVQEYNPPPPETKDKEVKKDPEKKDIIEVPSQPEIAETIIETEKEVMESESLQNAQVIDYLPQHKIEVAPVFPTEQIRGNIKYPVMANKQKIEGVVYLELYIDKTGVIRNIVVLKDPGYGLAEAAIESLEGIVCEPAKANGQAVAVRFRYPIRFKLK